MSKCDRPVRGTLGGICGMTKLRVNGVAREIEVDSSTPLLWAIREQLALTGTKFGCGISQCGACTVRVNGEAVRSCVTSLAAVEGKDVQTIEALATSAGVLHPLQAAWIEHQVPQCGYCQSGQLMSAAALLDANPNPTDAEIDAEGLVVTPICPHALSHRPLVLHPNSKLLIRVVKVSGLVTLAVDGQGYHPLEQDDFVTLERHPVPYPLLARPSSDPWQRLRERLGWRGSLVTDPDLDNPPVSPDAPGVGQGEVL